MRPVNERSAMIFRGTPGVGKTTVAREALRLLGRPGDSPISLDDGWVRLEFRYEGRGGPASYEDLRGRGEDVLIAELGWGEPSDTSFEGATRNPGVWRSVLEADGRAVIHVLLKADRKEEVTRLSSREGCSVEQASNYIEEFWKRPGMADFDVALGIRGRTIDITTTSPQEAAEELLKLVINPTRAK